MLSVKRRSSRSMSRAKGSALQGKPLRIFRACPVSRRRSRPRRSCRAACLDPGRWVGSVHRCLTPGSGRDGSICVARYGRDRRASCLAMRRTCRPAHSLGFPGSPSRRPCRFWRVRSAEVAVDIVVARCPGLVRTIGTIAVNKGCPTSMRCRQTEKAHHWTNASNSRKRGVSSRHLLGLRRRRWRRDESIERYRRYWWTWAHCGGWSTRRTTAERGGPTSTSWTSRRGSCAMRTAGNSTCSGEVTASHTGVSKVRGRRTDKRSSLRKGNWRCATSQASTR
jgi:hypothetical protein